MTQHSFIQGSPTPVFHSKHYSGHYSKIDYQNFSTNTYHLQNDLLQDGHVCFVDYLGYQYLSNQALISYPSLTMALRQLKDYPTFSKQYPVDKSFKGMNFIRYFLNFLIESEQDFQAEIAQHHATVNNLIQLYGHERVTPVIDSVSTTHGLWLKISGVTWQMLYRYKNNHTSHIHHINIDEAFNPYNAFKNFRLLEAFIPGTPYLAFRVAKACKHRGRLTWYSLETFQTISTEIINPYKPRIQTIVW